MQMLQWKMVFNVLKDTEGSKPLDAIYGWNWRGHALHSTNPSLRGMDCCWKILEYFSYFQVIRSDKTESLPETQGSINAKIRTVNIYHNWSWI